MSHRLSIIIGSTRPGRVGPVFANWLEGAVREHGKFDPVIDDLASYALPILDEPNHPRLGKYEKAHTRAWSAAVDAADAFVFVVPEYNFFAPPALVNAIDFLAREWNCKPASFLSYGGVSAGMRSVQSLKPLLTTVKVMPLPEAVAVPSFPTHLHEDGGFKPNALMLDSAKAMLDELHRWSEALKPLRQKAD